MPIIFFLKKVVAEKSKEAQKQYRVVPLFLSPKLTLIFLFLWELVGGGSVINGAYPSSFDVV